MVKGIKNLNTLNLIKQRLVYSLFWGRGSLYKRLLHIAFLFLSVSILLTGVNIRISSASYTSELVNSDKTGDVDILAQGTGIQTVLQTIPKSNYIIRTHTVKAGEKIEDLAKEYQVSKETIIWSNEGKIDYFSQRLNPGDVLKIPEVDGILYTVKNDDNLDKILKRAQGANNFEVVEINELYKSNNNVIAGSTILIPNAKFPAPPSPIPKPGYSFGPPTSSESLTNNVIVSALAGIKFNDPLSHPKCKGYSWSRGYFSGHNGVDLAKGGGCPIRAAAAGTVTYAGWGAYGEGYHVRIDHGNGVVSVYFHGDGNIWVKAGDKVRSNQEIMNMGCTGNCTGTHLHFGLRINGVYIDSSPYVPYYRPF